MSELTAQQKQLMIQTQNLKVAISTAFTRIEEMQNNKRIMIPKNYSVGNALNYLQLQIQNSQLLMSCSQSSIYKTALKMVVLGLSPAKQQGYPIAYSGEMDFFESYFGKICRAKRADPTIEKVISGAVRKGEVFEFENIDNDENYRVLKHIQTLESLDSDDFIAGYATIIYNDNKLPVSHIMTYKKIKSSWEKAQSKPFDEGGNLKPKSTHAEYTEDMIKRTVINRILKPILNTSDDLELFEEEGILYNEHEEVDYVEDLNNKSLQSQETVINNTASNGIIDIVIDDETGELID